MSTALKAGDLIMATGCTGYIGSQFVNQALKRGFKVRGVVRDEVEGAFVKEHFGKSHPGKFELAYVADFTQPGVYDEAMQGVQGVCHTASILSFSPKREEVVEPVQRNIRSIVQSALKTESLKRFVYTSSSWAALYPTPDVEGVVVDRNSWNEDSVKQSKELPDDHPLKPWHVYAASKMEGETLFWKLLKEGNAKFVANTVLPGLQCGPFIDNRALSTSALLVALYHADGPLDPRIFAPPPQYYMNVKDTALIHLGGLTSEATKNERLFAQASAYNWNTLLKHLRDLYPQKKFIDDVVVGSDLSKVDNSSALKILQEEFGQKEFIDLRTTVHENTAHLG